jgi:hypothetical protein
MGVTVAKGLLSGDLNLPDITNPAPAAKDQIAFPLWQLPA